MPELLYARAAPLHEAEVDEEIVALDSQQGDVFGFNRVASDVWRLLEEPKSFDQLCRELQELYDVAPDRCAEDTRDLLKEMTEMKLVLRIPDA